MPTMVLRILATVVLALVAEVAAPSSLGNQLRTGRHQPIPTDVSAEVADARLAGRGIK